MAIATVTTRKRIWTDEELEALPKDGFKRELLDGEIFMSPVHANHGIVCMRIGILLGTFVQRRKLGEVFDSSTGFRLSESLLLSPDVAFVSHANLKKIMPALDRFLCGAPDLAVEVLWPDDRMSQVHRKLDHYFAHGTQLAWLVNWQHAQVHIYTPDGIEALTRPEDTLTGGKALPGFRCTLRRVFGT